MARSKHVHKFICIGRKGYESKIWKCALPDCTWFVHLGLSHVMLGKPSICWECNERFIIDEEAMRDDMPKCNDCRLALPIVTTMVDPIVEAVAPVVQPTETSWRTPEQQKYYEKEMRDMLGPDWKKLLKT